MGTKILSEQVPLALKCGMVVDTSIAIPSYLV